MAKLQLFPSASRFFEIFLLIACTATICNAQAAPWEQATFSATPAAILQAASAIKADSFASVTILLEERTLVLDDMNRVRSTLKRVYRIETKEAIENWSSVSEGWSPWRQKRPEIKARVITADGGVHELDPKVLSEAPAHDTRPEVFDDERIYSGPLPAVAVGSVVETEVTTEDTASLFQPGISRRFYFGYRVPTIHTVLTIDIPASTKLKYNVQMLPAVKVTKQSSGGREIIRFDQGEMKAVGRVEPDLPDDVPTWPTVEFATGPSWNAIAAAYDQSTKPRITSSDVEKVIAGERSQAKKRDDLIRLLVAKLHREIRYTGVEFGEASLIPHPPAETLAKKYGDCKDKASVLVSMLRAAGIDAKLALLATRSIQEVNTDLPGMGSFDHAIVFVPGSPDLWIDATAEFTEVGQLPWEDQGRLALIIDPATEKLVKTPFAPAQANLLRETREFYLSELGPARIVEISRASGPLGSFYRSRYGQADSKDIHDDLDRYAKDAYLAEGPVKITHSVGTDLGSPFELTIEIAKGKRGSTGMRDAAVAIPFGSILGRLPDYLKREPSGKKDEQDDDEDTDASGQRKHPLLLQSFATEWRYKIVPPPSFTLRALPQDKTEQLGPATLSQSYVRQADGTVLSNWRFEMPKTLYTAEEVRALQHDIETLLKGESVILTFDQEGFALLASGKPREAMQSFESIAKKHPKEALHHLQLAQALLEAGFGEEARNEARKAVALEPNSAQAHQTLGWILQHDRIGRRFKSGFDLKGSIEAYKKAEALDPKDTTTRADLAILLEHDSTGARYTAEAKLDEAITEYLGIAQVDKEDAAKYETNLLYDYFYRSRYSDLEKLGSSIGSNEWRDGLRLAGKALADNTPAAIELSKRLGSGESGRTKALANATELLVARRQYAEAADLLEAAVAGQENAANLQMRIRVLRNTHKFETQLLPPNDPRRIVQDFFVYLIEPVKNGTALLAMIDLDSTDTKKHALSLSSAGNQLRASATRAGITPVNLLDTIISNMQISPEGDDPRGYRIRIQSLGAQSQTMLVAKRPEGAKIVAMSSEVTMVGNEVLQRIAKGDLSGAKQWLDWARELQQLQMGDDPLGGAVFPRLWNRGDAPARESMTIAAMALLSPEEPGRTHLSALRDARQKATKESEQTALDLAILNVLEQTEDWAGAAKLSEQLLTANPTSATAFAKRTNALRNLGDWPAWQAAIDGRLQRLPDDPIALRSRARLAEYQGDMRNARETLKGLIDAGRANAEDMNAYSWIALFLGPVTEKDLELASNSSAISQHSSFPVLHTLACLYAEVGKTKESRDAMLKAMAANGLEEPNSEIWFIVGRLAEQFGLKQAAASAYAQVEKPEKNDGPTSTYQLTQSRLKLLGATAKAGSVATAK